MIDIRQMRYFVVVAENRHFGRAAEALHVTQPPLSRQIAALEKALGVTLLDRKPRGTGLTAAGERFLADSRLALAAFDQACRNAARANAGELGELTIGFMMHAAYSSMPPLTRRFVAAHPQVQVHLHEILPGAVARSVLDGKIDAGITFGPAAVRGLASLPVHSETLCLALTAQHRLAGRDRVGARDLAEEPLIVAPGDSVPTLRRAIEDYFAREGLEPLIRLEAHLQQTIVSLVAEELGVALVPRSLSKLRIEGVHFVELERAPSVEHVLVWRPDNLNPVLPRFLAAAS